MSVNLFLTESSYYFKIFLKCINKSKYCENFFQKLRNWVYLQPYRIPWMCRWRRRVISPRTQQQSRWWCLDGRGPWFRRGPPPARRAPGPAAECLWPAGERCYCPVADRRSPGFGRPLGGGHPYNAKTKMKLVKANITHEKHCQKQVKKNTVNNQFRFNSIKITIQKIKSCLLQFIH